MVLHADSTTSEPPQIFPLGRVVSSWRTVLGSNALGPDMEPHRPSLLLRDTRLGTCWPIPACLRRADNTGRANKSASPADLRLGNLANLASIRSPSFGQENLEAEKQCQDLLRLPCGYPAAPLRCGFETDGSVTQKNMSCLFPPAGLGVLWLLQVCLLC